jgi:hypothetical protein
MGRVWPTLRPKRWPFIFRETLKYHRLKQYSEFKIFNGSNNYDDDDDYNNDNNNDDDDDDDDIALSITENTEMSGNNKIHKYFKLAYAMKL